MKWIINKKVPKKFLEQFPEYSRLTLQLLWDRNIKTQEKIDEFFNPDYSQDLFDPYKMKGMKKAVKRINKALLGKEKIAVFGDFDADGVCSTAIISEALKKLGSSCKIYIPNRDSEGYGLNQEAIKKLNALKINLIITVDCGVTDYQEINLANKLGMDVVVIDHHEVSSRLPPACAIVNPKQKNEKYPFKNLAAAGVTFKVVQALLKDKKDQAHKGWEKWLLDLVAIATVTDCMPLIGENRTLVKYGLVVLAQTKRLGLKQLMKIAQVKPSRGSDLTTNLDAYTIGYIIGPRINAAGRIGHASTAYKLLTTKSKDESKEIALNLENKNRIRQNITYKIIKEIEKREIEKEKFIFEGDKDWSIGIAGIIASKISNKYYRPVIVFQDLGEESKGSARSIPELNIIEAIKQCQDYLEDFGGHPGAAGFTIKTKNIEKFRNKLLKIIDKKLKPKDFIPKLKIDLELDPSELNFNLHEEIQKFNPFGQGNINPLFLMKDLKIDHLKVVGNNGGHLKMRLIKNRKYFQAIGFGMGHFYDKIKKGDKIDICFELITNDWNGERELQLKLIDLK